MTAASRASLATRAARLATLSPRRTLERGYSITSDEHGRVITDAAAVPAGSRLRTVIRHGRLDSTVDAVFTDESEQMYDPLNEPSHP